MDHTENRRCPFLSKPLPECYCARPQSIWAVMVVDLCGGDYERCEIYRRNWPAGDGGSEKPENEGQPNES